MQGVSLDRVCGSPSRDMSQGNAPVEQRGKATETLGYKLNIVY